MRFAILSDIHEDVFSLQRALIKIEKENCDEIVCLGDISGFSVPYYHHHKIRNAHECLRLIRENCNIVILGNHDLNAAKLIPCMSPLFEYPSDWYELDYFSKKKISADNVWLYEENELVPYYTASDIDYLRTLPQYQVTDIKGDQVLFSHYLYPNIMGVNKMFFHEIDEFSTHMDFMRKNRVSYSFVGHSHPPICYAVSPSKKKNSRFKKLRLSETPAAVMIPALAGNRRNNGFCIFDATQKRVEIKYI